MSLLPEGYYRAKARSAKMEATQAGNPVVVLDFELTEGEYVGQRIKWDGYFSDKTAERSIEALIHCGWTTGDLSDLTGIDANVVSLQIKHEPVFKGEGMRARVAYVNKDRGPKVDRSLDPATVASFAEQMQAKVAIVRQKLEDADAAAAAKASASL